jgi:hypothetical protein
MNQATEVNVRKQPVRKAFALTGHSSSPFTVAAAMKTVEQMRKNAESNYTKYEVMGRKATLAVMSQLYEIWCEAKESGEFDSFMSKIKQRLKDLDVKPRANSHDSGLLIRYVFEKVSDKQVSVYGRSLDYAYDVKKTPAKDFAALIGETNGGFDALVGKGKGGGSAGRDIGAALFTCKQQPSVAQTKNLAWIDGQEYQVLIAVRDEGDKVALKDALLTEDQSEELLFRFLSNKKKLDKPPKKKKRSKETLELLSTIDEILAEQQSIVEQLTVELKVFKAEGRSTHHHIERLQREQSRLDKLKSAFEKSRK